MSLASLLPAPKSAATAAATAAAAAVVTAAADKKADRRTHTPLARSSRPVPLYGNRSGFVPRHEEDFGDGGSFPEIHRLQHPLGMGRHDRTRSTALAHVSVDKDGNADYSAVVRQGIRKEQQVFHNYKDLIPQQHTSLELQKPDKELVDETTLKTREALEKLTNGKIAAAQSRTNAVKASNEAVYVRYAPSRMGSEARSQGAAEQRVIRMHEMPVDPMEPPKFKHKKAPIGPGSPPVPIMHSPPRKVTVAEQQNWKIPPCISNWKNIKGYTIAADKRLAADGRGLNETQINDKFASFSEAMYLAERNARASLQARRDLQKTVEMKKREHKEDELKKLAQQAREKRAGLDRRIRQSDAYEEAGLEESAVDDLEEREEVRRDLKRDLRRDLRMSHMGTNARKSKMERDSNRDVSEQIALGKQVKGTQDSLFDQRLFNQSQGMSSGFGAADSYNAYDKPLFDKAGADRIYRPSKEVAAGIHGDDIEAVARKSAGKFQPDRGFKGAETTTEAQESGRDKPVQFERGGADSLRDKRPAESSGAAEDPFAFNQFLSETKRGKALDHIGRSGHMAASGGSSTAHGNESSHRGNVQFTAAASSSKRSRDDRDEDRSRGRDQRRRR